MAQNFYKITTLDLSYVVRIKSTVEISQNFVAFSEYMNFNTSADYVLISADILLKIITILKELRIAQLCS